MSTEFVLEVFSEVQFFRNDCIMLNFFCTYIHFIIARTIITILLLLYLLRSIQLTTLHPPLANRLSYLFDTLSFLFVVPSPTKLNKRTKKEKKKKNRYVARYARNLVFFLCFRSYENVGLKVYEGRV